jgi:hypothetical protein
MAQASLTSRFQRGHEARIIFVTTLVESDQSVRPVVGAKSTS